MNDTWHLEPGLPRPSDDSDEAFRQAVADGVASLDAGKTVPYEAVRRWLLSWDKKDEIPPPECP